MEMTETAKKSFFPWLLLLILLVGCSVIRSIEIPSRGSVTSTTRTVPAHLTIIETTQTIDPVHQPTTALEVNNTPEDGNAQCQWPPVKISDQARVFFWTLDSRLLAYRRDSEKEEWFAYDLESKETKFYVPQPPYSYDHMVGRLTLEETKTIANKYRIEKFQEIYESSINKIVIYGLLDDMNDYQMYSKKLDDQEPTYLGKIRGNIDRVYWFKDGRRALLAIDWLSAQGIGEGLIYIVDLEKNNINIEIPADFRDLEYYGITPDENTILFAAFSQSDDLLHFWDINRNEDEKTTLVVPLTFQWLSNGTEMVGVARLDGLEHYVFRYNITDQRVTRLLELPLPIHKFSRSETAFSPNLKYVGFIHDMDNGLYILDCSNLNLQ